MTDFRALIAKQREKLEVVRESTLDVEFGGEMVTVGVSKVMPEQWDALIGACPPRPGREDDAQVGYNPKALASQYPNITVDGEKIDPEVWAEGFAIMDPTWRNNIEITIWGVNINESLRALRELGKARAGRKSPSPAN
ncbi:hypothetical protein [Microbacterium sp. NPDC055599]